MTSPELLDYFGDPVSCLERDDTCAGPVGYHSINPGVARAFPRCRSHWLRRLEGRDDSAEREATARRLAVAA